MAFDFEKVTKAAAFGVAVTAGLSQSAKAAVVINELYTSGGSASAPLKYDFVELYNNGSSAVSLSGLYLQYASATGAFVSVATNSQNFAFASSASIAAGGYYLVLGLSATGTGTTLSSYDASSALNMSGSAGKLRLITGASSIASTSSADNVIDFVGYGSATGTVTTGGANLFEGTKYATSAGATNFTSSFQRLVDGVDSDSNVADFTYAAYTPKDSTAAPEPASLGVLAIGAGLMIKRRRK